MNTDPQVSETNTQTESYMVEEPRENHKEYLHRFRDVLASLESGLDDESVSFDEYAGLSTEAGRVDSTRLLPTEYSDLSPLVSHEVGNMIMSLGYMEFLKEGLLEGEEMKMALIHGPDCLTALRNLMFVIEEMAYQGKSCSINDLISTFPDYFLNHVEIYADSDMSFGTLEQALSVRTVIHNSINASIEKRKGKGRDEILLHGESDDDTTTFVVIDNVTEEWNPELRAKVRNQYEEGFNNKSEPYPSTKGGLKMVAYLAGQRGDSVRLCDHNDKDLTDIKQLRAKEGLPVIEGKAIKISFSKYLNLFSVLRRHIQSDSPDKQFIREIVEDISSVDINKFVPPNLQSLVYHEYRNNINILERLTIIEEMQDDEDLDSVLALGEDSINATINFIHLLKTDFSDPSTFVDLETVLNTFSEHKRRAVNINTQGTVRFASLDEALTVRTLLDNAFKEASYQFTMAAEEDPKSLENMKNYNVEVICDETEEGEKYFVVADDTPKVWNTGRRNMHQEIRESFILGVNNPQKPDNRTRGGLNIVAYLAGQRKDSFELFDEGSPSLTKLNEEREQQGKGSIHGKAVMVFFGR